MSVFIDKTSAFSALFTETYSCTGTFTVTLPLITDTDQGAIVIANQGLGIISVVPYDNTNTVKKKTSYPILPGQFAWFISDKVSNYIPAIASRTTQTVVPLIQNGTQSTSSTSDALLSSYCFVVNPSDYGFPWATTITASLTYFIGNAGGSTTTVALFSINLSTGAGTEITGSRTTRVGQDGTDRIAVSGLTLTAGTKYSIGANTSSVLNNALLYGAVLTLTFS